MKNILVLSNLSLDNGDLLKYSAEFCKYYKCKIHLLHISEDDTPLSIFTPYYYKKFSLQFEQVYSRIMHSKIAKFISPILDNSMVRCEIQKGNKSEILSSFLNDRFIDLIIMGNLDIKNLGDESDTKHLLFDISETPILVVPEFEKFKPLQKFNFLTRHSPEDLEDLKNLELLFSNPNIQVTHLNPTKQLNVKEKKWLERVRDDLKADIIYKRNNKGLRAYLTQENFAMIKQFDAIVFTAKKRNFWRRLFDPSTTLSFLSSLELPSLIFKIS